MLPTLFEGNFTRSRGQKSRQFDHSSEKIRPAFACFFLLSPRAPLFADLRLSAGLCAAQLGAGADYTAGQLRPPILGDGEWAAAEHCAGDGADAGRFCVAWD